MGALHLLDIDGNSWCCHLPADVNTFYFCSNFFFFADGSVASHANVFGRQSERHGRTEYANEAAATTAAAATTTATTAAASGGSTAAAATAGNVLRPIGSRSFTSESKSTAGHGRRGQFVLVFIEPNADDQLYSAALESHDADARKLDRPAAATTAGHATAAGRDGERQGGRVDR